MSANILAIETLAARLAPRQRLVGVDLGTKTIGLAVSDVERRIATPMKVIIRKKFTPDAGQLIAFAGAELAGAMVFGLPVNMDGTEGPRAQATRAFARSLAGLTAIPVVFWDERLSTAAAERNLIAADVSRAKRSKVIDAAAAAYILQGALDRLAHMARAAEPG